MSIFLTFIIINFVSNSSPSKNHTNKDFFSILSPYDLVIFLSRSSINSKFYSVPTIKTVSFVTILQDRFHYKYVSLAYKPKCCVINITV